MTGLTNSSKSAVWYCDLMGFHNQIIVMESVESKSGYCMRVCEELNSLSCAVFSLGMCAVDEGAELNNAHEASSAQTLNGFMIKVLSNIQ